MNKPEGMSNLDIWNKVAGCDIRNAAIAHGLLFLFKNFNKAVQEDRNEKNGDVIRNLCLLFGASTIIQHSTVTVEGGFLTPEQLSALRNYKEFLL